MSLPCGRGSSQHQWSLEQIPEGGAATSASGGPAAPVRTRVAAVLLRANDGVAACPVAQADLVHGIGARAGGAAGEHAAASVADRAAALALRGARRFRAARVVGRANLRRGIAAA